MEYQSILLNWNTPKDVTYPTPPYISLRENLGPIKFTPIILKRKFLNMRKKFDLNDLSYEYFGTQDQEQGILTNKYTRKKVFFSGIRDLHHKYFVYENDHLKAKELQGDNIKKKEIFQISYYAPMEDNKQPVTLKLKNSNKYLVYNLSQFTLESANEDSLREITDSSKHFLFYQNRIDNVYISLEPATSLHSYLSTAQENGLNVTVEPDPVQSREISFLFDDVLFGNLLNVAPGRIALNPLRGISRFDNFNFRYLRSNDMPAIGFCF